MSSTSTISSKGLKRGKDNSTSSDFMKPLTLKRRCCATKMLDSSNLENKTTNPELGGAQSSPGVMGRLVSVHEIIFWWRFLRPTNRMSSFRIWKKVQCLEALSKVKWISSPDPKTWNIILSDFCVIFVMFLHTYIYIYIQCIYIYVGDLCHTLRSLPTHWSTQVLIPV